MIQLAGNQFGFDRGGFRVLVLCAAPRRDILLGKNLALAPLALGLGILLLVLLEVIYPMRLDHFLAALPQLVTLYLLFCILANWLSILAPLPVASGSFKPAQTRLVPVLLQMAFTMLFPWIMMLTLLPVGLEWIVTKLTAADGVPISLTLSSLEVVGAGYVYWLFVGWQGRTLQSREKKILEVVASKV
jgi:hypothetical protein